MSEHARAIIAQAVKGDEERFWSKVVMRGPDECWEWQGSRNGSGYGHFRVGDKVWKAHRYVMSLMSGVKFIGLVLHSCDNPPCVNPYHLRCGTPMDNVKDRELRKRSNRLRGEVVGTAKLVPDQVRKIRKLSAEGKSMSSIAKKFGVTTANVSLIVNRKSWTHV